jgi:uncharacterized membrane protein
MRMPGLPARAVAGLLGEVLMVFGYFAYEALALGYGIAAISGMPFNVMQAVLGVAASTLLSTLLLKIPGIERKE